MQVTLDIPIKIIEGTPQEEEVIEILREHMKIVVKRFMADKRIQKIIIDKIDGEKS